jgi:hypothetical protein
VIPLAPEESRSSSTADVAWSPRATGGMAVGGVASPSHPCHRRDPPPADLANQDVRKMRRRAPGTSGCGRGTKVSAAATASRRLYSAWGDPRCGRLRRRVCRAAGAQGAPPACRGPTSAAARRRTGTLKALNQKVGSSPTCLAFKNSRARWTETLYKFTSDLLLKDSHSPHYFKKKISFAFSIYLTCSCKGDLP